MNRDIFIKPISNRDQSGSKLPCAVLNARVVLISHNTIDIDPNLSHKSQIVTLLIFPFKHELQSSSLFSQLQLQMVPHNQRPNSYSHILRYQFEDFITKIANFLLSQPI